MSGAHFSEGKKGMSNPKIRFVIAGTGAIAPVHAEAMRHLRDVKLVAFFGSDRFRLERLSRAFSVSGYQDWETLCQSEQFDAVDVVTHSGRHTFIGLKAALHGKHLLIEKPMATVVEEGEQLVEHCQKAGLLLGVVYQHRFDPDLQKLKKWLSEGELGEIFWVGAHLLSHRDPSYYQFHPGRSDPSLTGGGALINQGIHLVDLLLWLLGPVRAVHGKVSRSLPHLAFEDMASGILQFANGTLATLTVTTACPVSQPSRIEIHGSLGSAVLEDFKLKKITRNGRQPDKTWQMRQKFKAYFQKKGTHQDVLEDFVEALRRGHSPCVDGREALKSLAVVLALYESSRTGTFVLVDGNKSDLEMEKVLK